MQIKKRYNGYINMVKLLLVFLFTQTFSLFAIDMTLELNATANTTIGANSKAYFGEELFKGNFKDNTQFRYNPDYLLSVGDVISVKMWGAFDFAQDLTIDKQGNIFIPSVGTVHLLGAPNNQLKSIISTTLKGVFNDNVSVYADVKQYQPITVFVSGSVEKVGLYTGLSTDSALQFIDKAGGIIRGQGSYRHVSILRNKKVVKNIDLYQFLISGQIDLFQFRNGDVILVKPLQNIIEVDGDVNRPYIFELAGSSASVQGVMSFVLPKPTTNSFMLTSWNSTNENTKEYPLSMSKKIKVRHGNKIRFFSSHYVNTAEVIIDGEHKGVQNISVKRGTTLYSVLSRTKFTPLSDIKNIRIYRESVASVQKQLIENMLQDLEARTLTYGSSTPEEAGIRANESSMVINFIDRARKVMPKGQVIIDASENLNNTIIEHGDRIFIPKKTNIIVVQGEVSMPSAITYRPAYTMSNYIKDCGGYSERANKNKILLIKANGKIVETTSTSSVEVEAGDNILVLGKVDTKNMILAKDIFQIMYQLAVGAAVVLKAF